MNKVIIKVKPKVVFNDESGMFTISPDSNEHGGAVISNTDLSEAMKRFKEGTQLCAAVKTLMDGKNFFVVEFI